MKKILLFFFTLTMAPTSLFAQKYLDIYRDGKIVSSVKAAEVDSLVIDENNNRTVDFYHKGEAYLHTSAAMIDSIKVFHSEDEPLVYLGIVGFNQELYDKAFGVLDKNTASGFKYFVSNLPRKDGTLLYYGVDQALDMLTKQNFPTQVSSVNLITFTDGLDQGSLMMSSNYSTDEEYLNTVSKRIDNTNVKGLQLTAYSMGLKGSDVSDYTLFQSNLNKLASSSDKAFEVNSMSNVDTRLSEISDQIISISNKQNISMKIPGQSNGTLIRFIFDGYSADNSSMYIEGTFNLSDRSLRNITYKGLKAESGSTVTGKQDGIFVTFSFIGLQRKDRNGLVPTSNIQQYYKSATATSWQENSEFTPANNTLTTITHSGAIILLVLDCSSSLGSQFSSMQGYAMNFIDRVANNAAEHQERPFGTCSEGSGVSVFANGVKFSMVKVKGGWFWMGQTSEQQRKYDEDSRVYYSYDENPVHKVTISDYYIGETEVTQELWEAVMGSNPSYFKGSSQLPVENVSWNDCQEFIKKLNALTGKKFRLPTEAEWEFAARGGTAGKGYKYSGSDNIADVAWYSGNSSSKTYEVGTKAPNELGLYDMSGNVWEWCQDWYGSYSSNAQTNPTGASSGSDRVLRGGGYRSSASACRVSDRSYRITPSGRQHYIGFRLALTSP